MRSEGVVGVQEGSVGLVRWGGWLWPGRVVRVYRRRVLVRFCAHGQRKNAPPGTCRRLPVRWSTPLPKGPAAFWPRCAVPSDLREKYLYPYPRGVKKTPGPPESDEARPGRANTEKKTEGGG